MSTEVAQFIIKEYYGDTAEKVASALQEKSNQNLSSLKMMTRLHSDVLRQIIILLIKASIVEYSIKEKENPETFKSDDLNNDMDLHCVYSVNKSQVFHISRLPSYINLVKNHFREEGFGYISQHIIETLTISGMMTAEDCVHSTFGFIDMCENSDIEITTTDTWKVFEQLLKDNFLMMKNSTINKIDVAVAASKKKSVKKQKEALFGGESEMPMERSAKKKLKTTYITSETDLFTDDLMNSLQTDKAQVQDENILPIFAGHQFVESKNTGKNKDDQDYANDVMFKNELTGQKSIFVVNFRKIVNDIRTKCIVNIAKERVGFEHSRVQHILQKLNTNFGKGMEIRRSDPFSLEQIIKSVPNSSGASIDRNKMIKIQDELASDSITFLKKITNNFGADKVTKYSVNLEKVVYIIQLKILEKIIGKKFNNKNHMRVFRAVQSLGVINDQQVHEVCQISLQESRSILVDLMKEGIIETFEYKNAKGYSAYAYTLKVSKFMRNFIEPIFKMKLNIMVKEKDLNTKVDELKKLTEIGLQKELELSEYETKLKKFKVASNEIDYSLMYFSEF